MKIQDKWEIPYPGFRNIKTALAVVICLAIYHVLDRDGVTLAAIAAMISMQDSVEKSIHAGFNRVIGTIIGGLFGIVFMMLNLADVNFILLLATVFVGTVLLIYVCNLIHIQESISIGCVVYLMILIDTDMGMSPFLYSVDRVVNTIAGIVIAIIVNQLVYRPKPERILYKRQGIAGHLLEYQIKRYDECRVFQWNGGTSTELYIHPKNALYTDMDFQYRLSTSKVETEESVFTKMKGYMRHLMVLKGDIHLSHEKHHSIRLEPYGQDFFYGGWNTHCYGKGEDLGLVLNDGYQGELVCVTNGEALSFTSRDTTGFFSLYNGNELVVAHHGQVILQEELNEKDFIFFNATKYAKEEFTVVFNNEQLTDEDTNIVRVNICKSMGTRE